MRIAKSVWAGAVVLAMTQAAQALPPKLQGKYAVMVFEQCTASFSAPTDSYRRAAGNTGPGIKSINSQQNGEFGIEVGTMTFTAPAAAATATGNATVVLTGARGHALRINGGGSAVTVQTDSLSGPFTITPTQFTFKPTGEPTTLTWTATYGNIVAASGVVRTIYMVRKESNLCVQAIQATKQ